MKLRLCVTGILLCLLQGCANTNGTSVAAPAYRSASPTTQNYNFMFRSPPPNMMSHTAVPVSRAR